MMAPGRFLRWRKQTPAWAEMLGAERARRIVSGRRRAEAGLRHRSDRGSRRPAPTAAHRPPGACYWSISRLDRKG